MYDRRTRGCVRHLEDVPGLDGRAMKLSDDKNMTISYFDDSDTEVSLERIPDRDKISEDGWRDWCDKRDFHTVGKDGRGAWIWYIGEWIGGANWLLYKNGILVDVLYDEELDDESIIWSDEVRKKIDEVKQRNG